MTDLPPRPEPLRTFVPAEGGEIAAYEWPADGPALLFAHATSFNARVWDEVIRLLPEFRCIAIDMPGHGASLKWPEGEVPDWERFGRDIVAVGEHFGLRDATAIGHSMGGFAVTLATWLRPGMFGRLLLTDPVISPPRPPMPAGAPSAPTRTRRDRWASPDEMFERFRSGPPFGDWDERVLRAYVEHGLVATGEGDYRLACPPHCENSIYAGAGVADLWGRVPEITVPVRIIRARERREENPAEAFQASPTAPGLVARFPNAVEVSLPDRVHFFPMESPGLVASELRLLLADHPA